MSAVTCTPERDDEGEHHLDAAEQAFLASLPRRLRIVSARSPLTRDALPARADCEKDAALGETAQAVWDAEKDSARALAARYRALSVLFVEEASVDLGDGHVKDDISTARAAIALRVTQGAARWELRAAHRAVDQLPRTLALLESGSFPSWWFQRMLRTAEDLSDESRIQLDVAVSTWSTDIAVERFITLLNALVGLLARREEEPETPPPPRREVTVVPSPGNGSGSLVASGPIPEILAYWKRLDETARAIQAAQRRALREGTEIPYDVDEIVTTTGRPLPLDRLRYELQLGATFDTDGVHVPQERFRLNVTVPVLTLLGVSDAPGMLEGTTPIPPLMARELAGRQTTWYRVLTDGCPATFLPLPAERYTPSPAMLEHLRLRNSTCAVPGCTRPTSWASECDHIEEFDHDAPEQGGRTAIENLHLLCWSHHQDKTAGLLDPTRLPTGEREPGRTRWRIGSRGDHVDVTDDTDSATLVAVAQLEKDWERHLAHKNRPRPSSAHRDEADSPPLASPPPPRPEIPPGPWDPDDPPPF